MAAVRPPAKKTWTPQALQAFTAAWLGKAGNAPTQQMLSKGYAQEHKTPNPPAQPFLTGDQMLGQSDAQLQRDQQVQELLSQLAQAKTQAAYNRKNVERARVRGVADSQDAAAARGIFQSSIKDGQIYDINAQAATQQQQINDQLQALQASASSRINLLDEALRRSLAAFSQMAVENASQIDTGHTTSYSPASPWPTSTTTPPSRPATPATPAQRQTAHEVAQARARSRQQAQQHRARLRRRRSR